MPKLIHRPPAYRLHRGLAVVTLDGKDIYLGPHGSKQSRDEYQRLIAEWRSRGCRPDPRPERRRRAQAVVEAGEPIPLTIVELIDRYLAYADSYYVKNGRGTSERHGIRAAFRPLQSMYGRRPARGLRPRHLKAVRQALVDAEMTRGVVNQHVGRIVRLYGWAVEEELIPVRAHERLKRVRGLRKGKTTAKDNPPVRAVDDTTIERTLPWLPPTVQALVRFQRLTGCRPGEAVAVRPVDVDTSGEVWTYVPAEHKTEHHGHERRIFIGPRAQDLLRPLLLRASEAYCFDPRDSEKKRRIVQREARKTKVQPSQRNRGKAAPKRSPCEHYSKDSYRRAVARAIDRANQAEKETAAKEAREPALIPHWWPNMLRHSRATELRREFGIEAARTCLGHSDPGITLVYAEADQKLAADVARRTG